MPIQQSASTLAVVILSEVDSNGCIASSVLVTKTEYLPMIAYTMGFISIAFVIKNLKILNAGKNLITNGIRLSHQAEFRFCPSYF